MVAYIAARGLPVSSEIDIQVGLLDKSIEERSSIPMSMLMRLHSALATAIKPALPLAVEQLFWDARANGLWNKFAPVQSIRFLIITAIVFVAIFLSTIIFGSVTEASIAKSIVAESGSGIRLTLMLFYMSLAGIGATFAVLYDAREYTIKGQYDPRVASNYLARIVLGLIAGLLLSQVLSANTGQTSFSALETVGKPILALVGGFAAQFVYSGLKRIVDALESIFRPDKEIRVAYDSLVNEAARRETTISEMSAREAKVAALAAQLAAARTNAERAAIVDKLASLGADAGAPADSAGAQLVGPDLDNIERQLDQQAAALDALPERDAGEERRLLARLRERVGEVRQLVHSASPGDVVGLVGTLAREVSDFDPVRKIVAGSISRMLIPAGGPLAAVGIGLAIVRAARELRGGEYARWQARILGSPVDAAELLDPDDISESLAGRLFSLPTRFRERFADIADRPHEILDVVRNVVREGPQTLFGLFGDRFDSKHDEFGEALDEFRSALVDEDVIENLTQSVIDEFGQGDGRKLLDLIDVIRGDQAARTELERLVVLAGAAADPGKPIDLDALRDFIRDAGRKLAGGD